jgi:hypothetical protein
MYDYSLRTRLSPAQKGSHIIPREPTDSVAGIRTRVARVRAEYPNHLDYNGFADL